jgi:hypothetical protein
MHSNSPTANSVLVMVETDAQRRIREEVVAEMEFAFAHRKLAQPLCSIGAEVLAWQGPDAGDSSS